MIKKLIFLVAIVFSLALFSGCINTYVDAKVISINDQITEGYMIGHFLGSSDGFISNDIIKVGVEFNLEGKLFLADLQLSHAELVYYKNSTSLPLHVIEQCGDIYFYLNGRKVYERRDHNSAS